jgi:hypothetical protein
MNLGLRQAKRQPFKPKENIKIIDNLQRNEAMSI